MSGSWRKNNILIQENDYRFLTCKQVLIINKILKQICSESLILMLYVKVHSITLGLSPNRKFHIGCVRHRFLGCALNKE